MRPATLLAIICLLPAPGANAQGACDSHVPAWRVALSLAAVGAAAAVDGRVDAHYVTHRSGGMDRIADAGNAIGAGRVVEPALAVAFVGSLLLRRRDLSRDVLAVTLAYAAGNGLVGVLKPVVGRHRPVGAASPWSFHPMSGAGADHSWPSSHLIHVSAVAAATATLSRNPVVDVASAATVGLVGWSRVYSHQHWTSDVVSTAIIGALVARFTVHWAGTHHLLPATSRCPQPPATKAPSD